MNELQLFKYEGKEIRTSVCNDEPWFFAQDVAVILGYSATSAMLKRLDDDEQRITMCQDGTTYKKQALINESGLYNAALGSQLPTAKSFKKWVTSEVLPSIRKAGKYELSSFQVPRTFAEALRLAADQQEVIETQKQQLIEYQPKAEFFDQAMSSDDTISIKEAAKILGYGPNKLFAFLVLNKILFKSHGFYLPYQEQLEADRFKVIETPWPKGGEIHIYRRTAVTQRGLDYIRRRIIEAA